MYEIATNKDIEVRQQVASTLGNIFCYVMDKEKTWMELHRLTISEDIKVRSGIASALGYAFSYIPDKDEAWEDLHRLTTDDNEEVREKAACALGYAFSYISDRDEAWKDLHRLTNDDNEEVRKEAAHALGYAFSHILNKEHAWEDLHRLTKDEDEVRREAVISLGYAFQNVPDKGQAWEDLIKLTDDEERDIRTQANHLLGKISVFKASQAKNEDDYRNELEIAIEFFEKASEEAEWWFNPSQFCLPFYYSFYAIVFKKEDAEIDIYLEAANDAIEDSTNKRLLFEALQNLANALQEIQNRESMDLESKKTELDFYRKYCEHAEELMRATEEKTPFAVATMRKGLPILDRKLQSLLKEIQEKAKTACRESRGTETEGIACAVSREVKKWEIGSQEEMAFNVENLIFTLESSVPRIPQNQYLFNRIQQIREQKDVSRQYGIISTIIQLIPKIYMDQKVEKLESDIEKLNEKVDYVLISLKSGIKEEIEISVGTEVLGTGITHKITIPLQEISYLELQEDLEKITGVKIDKLSKVPKRLANKIKGYLLLHDKDEVLEKLI